MATVEKDFKVKNGLIVTSGGSFGGSVTVASPTEATHAATKEYVDSKSGSTVYSATEPLSPVNGLQWFDTTIERAKVYHNGIWVTMATYEDVMNVPQHIHDTSIGGTGLIVSMFTEGGAAGVNPVMTLDAGGPDTTEWTLVLDGGNAVDNFS